MIKSMTAFASAKSTTDTLTVQVEIRAFNSRFLDLLLRLPHPYQGLEEKIKELIGRYVERGRIEVRLQVVEETPEAKAFDIDMVKARAYYESLLELKNTFALAGEIGMDHLLKADGILKPAEVEKDAEALWPVLEACLTDAMGELDAMRRREGAFLAGDFQDRLSAIETRLDRIEAQASDLITLYQERLKERVAALTSGVVEIDPARIAQEAAFLADRSDISEEIVRARSHIKQFRSIMTAPPAAGRKLNFLLQEMGREFNTMGAKSANADVAHLIVAVKSELEKIREQVQNVE